MIGGKKVLAVIPARGGSKGVPRKNIRDVAGLPLIGWTIKAAQAAKSLDRVVLSSDDPEIIEVARSFGCEVPFVRPPELASDTASGIEPVIHAVAQLPGYDYVVLLQPTSPLRISDDIEACLNLCYESNAGPCVSMVESPKPPHLFYRIGENKKIISLWPAQDPHARRQDVTKAYSPNGAVYVASTNYLLEKKRFLDESTLAYVMPTERSLDIDTEFDLSLADFILRH